jgi:predicted MFS family arabinose efflux permease
MREPSPKIVVCVLGVTQILAWGSSFYLPAVLADPIAYDTGWPMSWVIGGLSIGLLISGLVSPLVGRRIHELGGRPVLVTSTLLLACGQFGLAASPSLPFFIAAWVVMGLGMGAGLYDAAFSTLGRLYGSAAHQRIAALTLFGGLASTICWPLSAFLVSELGWRGACAAYALIQLGICLPIHFLALPREKRSVPEIADHAAPIGNSNIALRASGSVFLLLATTITLGSVISTTISVYLLTILQGRGLALAAAVALGALVGPSQVGARFVEMLIGRLHHPIWTLLAAVIFMALGLWLLWLDLPIIPLALVFYGAGIGIESIARGTLPLALFGPRDYAPIMGRLALPALVAQAAAPTLAALLLPLFGLERMLALIVAIAALNVLLALLLFPLTREARRARSIS